MANLWAHQREPFRPVYADNELFYQLIHENRYFIEDIADLYLAFSPIQMANNNAPLLNQFKYIVDDYLENERQKKDLISWFSNMIDTESGYDNMRAQMLEDLTQVYILKKYSVGQEEPIFHEPKLFLDDCLLFPPIGTTNFDFVYIGDNNNLLAAYDAKVTMGGFLKDAVDSRYVGVINESVASDGNVSVNVVLETKDGVTTFLNDIKYSHKGLKKLQYGNNMLTLTTKADNVGVVDVGFTTLRETGIGNIISITGKMPFEKLDRVAKISLFIDSAHSNDTGMKVIPLKDILDVIFGEL